MEGEGGGSALVDPRSGATVRHWFEEVFARLHFKPIIGREVPDLESLLLLIETGQGVTIHTRRTIDSFPQFDLACVELEEPELQVETVLAWNSPIVNPSVELFVREFRTENA